jgi:hypothetical protein
VVDTVTLESDLIQENREIAEKFVRGFDEAVNYLKNHREETIAFISKKDKMPKEEVTELLNGLKILGVCEQKELFLPSGILGEAVKTSDLVMRRVARLTGPDQTVGLITFGPVQTVATKCP